MSGHRRSDSPARPRHRAQVLARRSLVLALAAAALAWSAPRALQVIDDRVRPALSGASSEGTGPTITPADVVALRYKLDASADGTGHPGQRRRRGQPFVTGTDGVFPGFGEGLQLMQAGGRYRSGCRPARYVPAAGAAGRAVHRRRHPGVRDRGRSRSRPAWPARCSRCSRCSSRQAPSSRRQPAPPRRSAPGRRRRRRRAPRRSRAAPPARAALVQRSVALREAASSASAGRCSGGRSRLASAALGRLAASASASASSSSDFCSSAALIIATIGSASARPMIPNRAPNRSCAPSTSAGARSTVLLGDVGDDQIAVDGLDDEIDARSPTARLDADAEADEHDQHARDDRADIGEEGEQAGEEAEQGRHRHAADQQQQPGADALDRHAEQPPGHQPAQRVAHPLGGAVEAVAAVAAAASRRRRARRGAARPR